jgi:hypothetical protein
MVETMAVSKMMESRSVLTHMAAQEDMLFTACESFTSYTEGPEIPLNNSGACWELENAKAPMNVYLQTHLFQVTASFCFRQLNERRCFAECPKRNNSDLKL